MSDIYNNSPHVKLSVEEEIKIIKRAKLSFYDDATEKERKLVLCLRCGLMNKSILQRIGKITNYC